MGASNQANRIKKECSLDYMRIYYNILQNEVCILAWQYSLINHKNYILFMAIHRILGKTEASWAICACISKCLLFSKSPSAPAPIRHPTRLARATNWWTYSENIARRSVGTTPFANDAGPWPFAGHNDPASRWSSSCWTWVGWGRGPAETCIYELDSSFLTWILCSLWGIKL